MKSSKELRKLVERFVETDPPCLLHPEISATAVGIFHPADPITYGLPSDGKSGIIYGICDDCQDSMNRDQDSFLTTVVAIFESRCNSARQ